MRAGKLIRVAAVLALALVLWPGAAAALTKEEAERKVAETYGVEVISKKTRAGEIDGRPVWFLTVMNPGGDFNAAFQVTTLAVDRDSGELVPAFRHRPSGYELPGPGSRGDKDGLRPDAARTRTWR